MYIFQNYVWTGESPSFMIFPKEAMFSVLGNYNNYISQFPFYKLYLHKHLIRNTSMLAKTRILTPRLIYKLKNWSIK